MSAVRFGFVLRNFLSKIKSVTGGHVSGIEQKGYHYYEGRVYKSKVQKVLVQYRKHLLFDPKLELKGCAEEVSSSLP